MGFRIRHFIRHPRHAACRPWPLFSREAGRAAVPSELKQVARHTRPTGDFCSRLFRCSQSLTLNLPKGSHSEQVRCSSRGLCAFYRHAGVIVPPGEPPDGTSPAMMPRQHHGGGAGSSPRNHRHDRCSRWEELTGIMEEGKRAWRERAQKIAGSAEIGGFGRQPGAGLSTSCSARHPSSDRASLGHLLPQGAKGERGNARSCAERHQRCLRHHHRLCAGCRFAAVAMTALPRPSLVKRIPLSASCPAGWQRTQDSPT